MTKQEALENIQQAAALYCARDFDTMHKILARVAHSSQYDLVWAQGIMYSYADEMEARNEKPC